MVKKHQERKGVGCRYEDNVDGESIICGYAELRFGKMYGCIAPKQCFMDMKIKNKFIEGKHCPNCSKINQPSKLEKIDDFNRKCNKCGYNANTTRCNL